MSSVKQLPWLLSVENSSCQVSTIQFIAGADPGIWERGGAQHTVFFRTAASLETRASPKKADKQGGGGGDSDTLFPERHLRRGGGGG